MGASAVQGTRGLREMHDLHLSAGVRAGLTGLMTRAGSCQVESILPPGIQLVEAAGGEPLASDASWVAGNTRIADVLVPRQHHAVHAFR